MEAIDFVNEKLAEAINQLNERESKRMLLQLFQEAEMTEQSLLDERQLTKRICRMYKDLIRLQPKQPLAEEALNHRHIAFGDSVAGSLRYGLSSIKVRSERVLAMATDLSNGPLAKLDEADGVRHRNAWLKTFIDGCSFDEDDLDALTNQLEAIKAIPEHVPVTVWASDNAWEQCGLALVAYLLRGRKNPIRVINPSAYEKQLFEEFGEGTHSAYSGELAPETLAMLFKKYAQKPPLTENERRQLESEWLRVSADPAVLRIWENEHVQPMSPDYFDAEILRHARRLARQTETRKGFLCVRLIGEVIGELHDKQWVGDTFIYWRIKKLIEAGKLTVNASPKQILHMKLTLNKE